MKNFISTFTFVVLLLFFFSPTFAQTPKKNASAQNTSAAQSALAAALAVEATVVEAIAKCEKSVVAIARVDEAERTTRNGQNSAINPGQLQQLRSTDDPDSPDFQPDQFATGIVIDRRGLILTNYHIIGVKSQHWVTTTEGKRYRARIKGADPRSDLAVLEIDARDLLPMPLGNAGTIKKGQFAIALGNPYAIARDGSASAAWGMIANLGRKVPLERTPQSQGRDKLYHYSMLIQTDAKLNLGTSGGALLNLHGEMVGLTTSLAAMSGYEQAAGYALPVDDTFTRVVNTLKEGREVEYGFLGIKPDNLTADERRDTPHGIRVVDIVSGTPAQRVGLRTNDIITHVDKQEIDSIDDLVLHVGKYPLDTKVSVSYVRNRAAQQIDLELTKYPVRGEKVFTQKAPAWRGLTVDYNTALPEAFEKASYLPALRDGGVVIAQVEHDSPAAKAGLRAGQFITSVNKSKIHTPGEFRAAVIGQRDNISLQVVTPQGEQTKTEKVEIATGN